MKLKNCSYKNHKLKYKKKVKLKYSDVDSRKAFSLFNSKNVQNVRKILVNYVHFVQKMLLLMR